MKNQTNAFSEMRHVKAIPLVYPSSDFTGVSFQNFLYKGKFFIQPAEFTDFTDPLGMFEEETEPENFFIDFEQQEQIFKLDAGDYNGLPEIRLDFFISDKKHIYERQRYSILMLVSDFGGF